mgnify:CR=1 FL=1
MACRVSTLFPDEEKQEFWKECRTRHKGALVEFCRETITKSQVTSAEHGSKTKARPLKWYTDQGFDGDWIEKSTPEEDKQVMHGTMCYRLPLAFMEESTRDETRRAQEIFAEPSKKVKHKATLAAKPGKLPPADLDSNLWSQEQRASWTTHVQSVADKQIKDLEDKKAEEYWQEMPSFIDLDAKGILDSWLNMKELANSFGCLLYTSDAADE